VKPGTPATLGFTKVLTGKGGFLRNKSSQAYPGPWYCELQQKFEELVLGWDRDTKELALNRS
jgi:hypothetical protein